jgi:hypothetical protein
MTPAEINAIAGHISVGVIRSYIARRADGLTTDAVQLATVTRRHFKMASSHYDLNDADQTELMNRLPSAFQRLIDEARRQRD